MTDSGALALASALVRQFEGCRLASYLDGGGVWTIGWGHTGPEVVPRLVWTQQQCDDALERDLAIAGEVVEELWLGQQFSPRQRAALTSLAYNVGEELRGSQLALMVRQKRWLEAAKQFPRWDHVNGRELAGLLRRRLLEAVMFVEGSGA